MAIEILKVSTGNPAKLVDEISTKIYNNQITTWDISGNKLSHKGEQYKNHFYFEFQINDVKGILEFILHTSGTSVYWNI